MKTFRSGTRRVAPAVAIASVAVLASTAASSSAWNGKADEAHFEMFANPGQIDCLKGSDNPDRQPTVDVTVERGENNDTATLRLKNFKPDLQFDLFTVENSNQNPDGTPVAGFSNFGLAWYQSDIHVNDAGRGDGEGQDHPARPDLRLRPCGRPRPDEHVPHGLLVQRSGRCGPVRLHRRHAVQW